VSGCAVEWSGGGPGAISDIDSRPLTTIQDHCWAAPGHDDPRKVGLVPEWMRLPQNRVRRHQAKHVAGELAEVEADVRCPSEQRHVNG
jgi:hypothetical protein